MEVKIFRRHSADCPDKADRYASRCGCPLWGEFNWTQAQTTLRDCGQNAIPQSSRYNFCRCRNMSTLSSRQLAPSGFARNGTKAGDSISGARA
jgi:hypothetical protein